MSRIQSILFNVLGIIQGFPRQVTIAFPTIATKFEINKTLVENLGIVFGIQSNPPKKKTTKRLISQVQQGTERPH